MSENARIKKTLNNFRALSFSLKQNKNYSVNKFSSKKSQFFKQANLRCIPFYPFFWTLMSGIDTQHIQLRHRKNPDNTMVHTYTQTDGIVLYRSRLG